MRPIPLHVKKEFGGCLSALPDGVGYSASSLGYLRGLLNDLFSQNILQYAPVGWKIPVTLSGRHSTSNLTQEPGPAEPPAEPPEESPAELPAE